MLAVLCMLLVVWLPLCSLAINCIGGDSLEDVRCSGLGMVKLLLLPFTVPSLQEPI